MALTTVTTPGGTPHGSLTSFVGRRTELAALRGLLTASRLVTIAGPGGVGKTRLAEELLASLARSGPPRAAAYLASATERADVVEVIAAAVGLRNMGASPTEAELVEYLGATRLVLLLDNVEHVAGSAAEVVAALLESCPGLAIVATGRRPLHVPGEQLFPIGGLAIEPSVQLFADRARLGLPGFVLETSSRASIEGICGQLEGMPLGIELAAAQVRALGLTELAGRLEGHMADLAWPGTVRPERQRTLRAAIDWSHHLLTESQQILWRRVSIFAGGFTLDAAEVVAGDPPLDAGHIARLLTELVDASMVVFDPAASRYRLVEVLREYARERLREAGEEAAIGATHRRWMIGLADETATGWFGPRQPELMDRFELELANLRAALEDALGREAFADGLRLARGGYWFWLTRASLEEGLRWFDAFLGRSGDPRLEAEAHWRAGYLAIMRLDYPAANAYLSRALRFADEGGDDLDRVYASGIGGLLLLYEHPERAEEASARCRSMFEDPSADATARQWGRIGYGLARLAQRDLQACLQMSLEAAEMGRRVGDIWGRELALRFVAHAEWQLGRHDAAEAALRECLSLDRRLGDLWHMAWTTEAFGWVSVDAGRFERGARLLGIAAGVWAKTGSRLADPWQAWHRTAIETLRGRLGERRLEAELAAGRALDLGEAIAYALGEPATARPASGIPDPSAEASLSERELEVSALIEEGLGNRAIADRLFLSPRTVEKHVQHVMDKLGLDSRVEIAAWHARRFPRSNVD